MTFLASRGKKVTWPIVVRDGIKGRESTWRVIVTQSEYKLRLS